MQGHDVSILNKADDSLLHCACHLPAAKPRYLHAHGFRNALHFQANGTHANNGQTLAAQGVTHFVAHGEKGLGVWFTKPKIHFAHAPDYRQHEPDGHFRRCGGRHLRNVGHRNAACCCSSNVNHIVAGAVIGNDLQLPACADNISPQGSACHHRICMGEKLH